MNNEFNLAVIKSKPFLELVQNSKAVSITQNKGKITAIMIARNPELMEAASDEVAKFKHYEARQRG